MQIQPMNFERISFQDANPALMGAESAQNLISNALRIYQQQMQNQQAQKMNPLEYYLAQVKAKYADPMAEVGLNEKRALAQKNTQEAAKLAYYQEHPELWGSGVGKDIATLKIAQERARAQAQAQAANQGNTPGAVTRAMLNRALPDQAQNQNYTPMPGRGIPGIETGENQAQQQIPQLPQSPQEVQTLKNIPWYDNQNIDKLIGAMVKAPEINNQSREMLINQRQNKLSGQGFDLAPANEKVNMLAQTRAAGYTDDQAVKMFHNNKSLPDLMQEAGYDPNDPATWPKPKYAPTQGDITKVHNAGAANAALNYIDPLMLEGYSKLGTRYFGFSPKAFWNQISGLNKEDQAKYLATYMMNPEYQTERQNAINLRTGIGALRHFEEKSLSNAKGFSAIVPSDVYQAAQEIFNNSIRGMNAAITQYYQDQGLPRPKGDILVGKNAENNVSGTGAGTSSKLVHMISPDGKEYDVPADKENVFLQNKFRRAQ